MLWVSKKVKKKEEDYKRKKAQSLKATQTVNHELTELQ